MTELTPEDKKSLKLFSYYIQSLSNSKKATITYELYDGYEVDYIGEWYTNNGKEIDGYEKINSLINKIYENLDMDDFFQDMNDSYEYVSQYRLEFEVDTTDNTLEITGDGLCESSGPEQYTEDDIPEDICQDLIKLLKKKEKSIATIGFDGAGDSGYINGEVEIGGKNYNNLINSELEEFLYNMLSHYGGWEINEGSFGRFQIDLGTGKIHLEFQYRQQDWLKAEKKIVLKF